LNPDLKFSNFGTKFNYIKTMGRGDKKTGKGKLAMGSYGKTRPHRPKKEAVKETAK